MKNSEIGHEEMDTFDLLVVFKNDSETVIDGVKNYLLKSDKNILNVEKNGYQLFFNWNEVRYCGRLSDLRYQEN